MINVEILLEKRKNKNNYLTFKDKNSDIKTSIFILKILDISYVDLVKKVLEKELGIFVVFHKLIHIWH